jgi:regulator of sigma E protease
MDLHLDVLRSALYFLAVLSALVIAHEWGHFAAAKLLGMKVEDFSLFFGKRLISLGVRNGTEYNIRCIPLGGFVKIAGMEPDDISNGAPIFRANNATERRATRILRGLQAGTLESVNVLHVSDRVRQAVEQAVGGDSYLSENGKQELHALAASTSINVDEQRYIDAILQADVIRPDPNGFNQRPLWQRAIVIAAGPFLSLLFGYLIFCVIGATAGLPDENRMAVVQIEPNSPADRAGIRLGDQILAVNDIKAVDQATIADAINLIHNNIGKAVHVVVANDRGTRTVTVVPYAAKVDETDSHGKVSHVTIGRIGFSPGYAWRPYPPGEAVGRGSAMIYADVAAILTNLFHHPKENVGGPIRIAEIIHMSSQQGISHVIYVAAELSISIGMINLFPIPILDGGHLLLLAIEAVRRRKLSSREMYTAQMVGISIIGVLFVWVMYNDISHLTHLAR